MLLFATIAERQPSARWVFTPNPAPSSQRSEGITSGKDLAESAETRCCQILIEPFTGGGDDAPLFVATYCADTFTFISTFLSLEVGGWGDYAGSITEHEDRRDKELSHLISITKTPSKS